MPTLPKYVIIDGWDYTTGTLIKKINVWKNYEDRSKGVVKKLKHGRRARLIGKKGRRLEIKAGWGRRGYISDWFTKEFKNG